MRALVGLFSFALAIAATSSLAQSAPSPDGNGFFAANPAPPDSGFFRPADDPALTPPHVRAPSVAELARVERLEEFEQQRQREEFEAQRHREAEQMNDLERQNEINRRESNPANVPPAIPGSY